MGLQLPKRARRLALGSMLGFSLLMLGACSAEDKAQASKWAMPANSPATEQAVHVAELWKWAWVTLVLTGLLVWGLIFFASWHFRRRSDDEIPVQTRYNLPLEIFYTIAPILMVIVFFFHTLNVQEELDVKEDPDVVVQVVGQQWSWTFNHTDDVDNLDGPVHYTAGTASQIPTLVLPVDQLVEFKLSSPDVIHSFWIPAFLYKLDVIPGQTGEDRNSFKVTPTDIGSFKGKCAELCGVYHSRMIFNVEVVSQEDYEAYLQTLDTADEPLLGGEHAGTTAGLDDHSDETGGEE